MTNWRAFGGVRALLWVLPLALLVGNLVWLIAFGSGSRLRASDLARTEAGLRRDNQQLAERLAAREKVWVAAHDNEEALRQLLDVRLSTERAHITDLIREVKELAQRAGLDPQTISYPRETLEQYGLVRRSFVLPVSGSYASLRTLLNLLEVTPSFLIVEEIGVAEKSGGLTLRLRLSTLFTTRDESAERPDS